MKRISFILIFLGVLLSGSLAFEPAYDDGELRVVNSFDIAGPDERTGIKGQYDSWGYINQYTFERVLAARESEDYLVKSYFNGTSEAKAYALVGLNFIKSKHYETLKADFIQHQGKLTIKCRVKGLKTEETPSAVVAKIDSGALSSRVKPQKK